MYWSGELRPNSNLRTSIFPKEHVEKYITDAQNLQSTRAGGNVVLVGMGSPVQTLPMSVVGNREVDLLGVWRYANTYSEAMKIMQASEDLSAGIPDIRS